MDSDLPAWLDRKAFPFSPRRVDLGQGEILSVTDVGDGPNLVFSHGTPTWSFEWRHMLKALSQRYRCVAPDHLGFGLSARPQAADYSPEAHARRFGQLLDATGVDRYHLVAHDFGGPFALDAALRAPHRVRSLTVINSIAWSFGDTPQRRRMAWLAGTPLFRYAYGAFNLSFAIARSAWGDRRTLTKETWAPYLPVFPDADSRRRVLWALARSMTGSAEYFDSLWARRDALRAVPTHFIWGLKDAAFPPAVLARFQDGFPHASTFTLSEAGHWPHEEQPEACALSLSEFLARVG